MSLKISSKVIIIETDHPPVLGISLFLSEEVVEVKPRLKKQKEKIEVLQTNQLNRPPRQ